MFSFFCSGQSCLFCLIYMLMGVFCCGLKVKVFFIPVSASFRLPLFQFQRFSPSPEAARHALLVTPAFESPCIAGKTTRPSLLGSSLEALTTTPVTLTEFQGLVKQWQT